LVLFALGGLFWDQVWSFDLISAFLGVAALGILSRLLPEFFIREQSEKPQSYFKLIDLALLAVLILALQAPTPLLSLALFVGGVLGASISIPSLRIGVISALVILGWGSLLAFSNSSGLIFVFELCMVLTSLCLGLWISEGAEGEGLKWDHLLKSAPYGVMVVDPDDKVVWVNSWIYEHLGSEGLGHKLSDLLPGFEVKDSNAFKVFDYSFTKPKNQNGETLEDSVGLLDIFCFFDAASGLRVFHLEEKTKAKQFLDKKKEEEQLLTLGAAVATLAHEIKNPLTSLSGAVELLGEGVGEPWQKRLVLILSNELQRLKQLTHEILSFSRAKGGLIKSAVLPSSKKINLEELLQETVNLFKLDSAMTSGIEVSIKAPSQIPHIFGDENSLKQVFLNLLQNSAQALANCSTKKIQIQIVPKITGIEIEFQDSGPGISEVDLPLLFEPFWTSKKKGTGLGLMVVKQIIESHGGQIKAKNGSLGGALFWIELPLTPEQLD
jgi:signal transduction histidine kinase